MIILRAGLVGCLAAYMLPKATLIDDRDVIQSHMALMRFRTNRISEVTGIPFKKVKVYKAVYSIVQAAFVPWNPKLANMYSVKVSNGFYNRSINNLDTVERWVSPPDFHRIMLNEIGHRLVKLDMQSAMEQSISEDVISTIPINEMCDLVEIPKLKDENKYSSIFVTTLHVENCDVNYTVYFPDAAAIYRATLQGESLIIESIIPLVQNEIEITCQVFGLSELTKTVSCNVEQKFGKIQPGDDSFDKKRLQTILRLTDEFRVYSLGRTATARSVLMDDCYDDIKKIEYMIKTPQYKRNLGIKQ